MPFCRLVYIALLIALFSCSQETSPSPQPESPGKVEIMPAEYTENQHQNMPDTPTRDIIQPESRKIKNRFYQEALELMGRPETATAESVEKAENYLLENLTKAEYRYDTLIALGYFYKKVTVIPQAGSHFADRNLPEISRTMFEKAVRIAPNKVDAHLGILRLSWKDLGKPDKIIEAAQRL